MMGAVSSPKSPRPGFTWPAMCRLAYSEASRYMTSALMRLKLGDALKLRSMAPHVFEGPDSEPAD